MPPLSKEELKFLSKLYQENPSMVIRRLISEKFIQEKRNINAKLLMGPKD
jgi:hypothetical protein